MSELNELEGRIAQALQRIRTGVEGLAAAPAEDMVPATEADALAEQLTLVTADLADATEALAAEKTRTAELQDKLARLQAAQAEAQASAAEVQAMTARAAAMVEQAEATEAELRTLRASVQELQAANAELRRSALTGVTDPALINRSLAADLEAVQNARLAELRDLDTILKLLAPVLEGSSNA